MTVPLNAPMRCAPLVATAIVLVLGMAACSDDDHQPTAPAAAAPGIVDLARTSWSQASLTADPDAGGEAGRVFTTEDRVSTMRWFAPVDRVERRHLVPDLPSAEGAQAVAALELYLRNDGGAWGPSSWGGIMCGLADHALEAPDLTTMAWLDLWVNDHVVDPAERHGKLHVDFGLISEDFFWPVFDDVLHVGTYQHEDANDDGVFTYEEDIGLDGQWNVDGTIVIREGLRYSADFNGPSDPYPNINNTARNFREDTEDLDHDDQFNLSNAYFTTTIDLGSTVPLVDVVQDYDDVDDLIAAGIAWRLYRIPIRRSLTEVSDSGTPDLANVRHMRIWFEDGAYADPAVRSLQLAGIRFF